MQILRLHPLEKLGLFNWEDSQGNGSADGFGGGQSGDGNDDGGGYTSDVGFGGSGADEDGKVLNTAISPATETQFDENLDIVSVTSFDYSSSLDSWLGNTVTSGWADFDFDTLTVIPLDRNTTQAQVEFGTIASHVYGAGYSLTQAVVAETIAKLALGFAFAGISPTSVMTAINIANKAFAGLGYETKDTYAAINLGLELASILFGSYQLAQLSMDINNPVIGILGLAKAGFAFSELGGEELSVDEIMASENNTGIYSEVYNTYINSVGYYKYSILGSSIQYNETALLNQVKPVIQQMYIPNTEQGDKMQIIYQEYKGGLNEVVAPHLIAQNEGQIFTNISTTSGTIKSIRQGTYCESKYRYKVLLDSEHTFVTNKYFTIAKVGNFFYILLEGRDKLGRLDLTSSILYEANIVNVDIVSPISRPVCTNIVTSFIYTATAALINIRDTTGEEETYTAAITSDFNNDIVEGLTYNKAVLISGTCSAGTPDGRTIIVTVEGKEFSAVSANETFSVTINDLSFLNTQSDRELWDEYKYAYTYYNEASGYESIPVFSDSWLRKNSSIKISNIKMPKDSEVNKIFLYRIGGYSTVYRRIVEIDNTYTDSTIEYIDDVQDLLTYKLLDTDNINDILNLQGLIEHRGSLLAFKNNQVYFSKPGKPNVWSEFQSVRVGGLVKAIASVPLGVLILTDNQKAYILSGTDKNNYSLSVINNTIGIVNNKSISYIQNSAIWLGYEGLMTTVGSAIQNLSRNQVKLDDIGEITCSFSYDKIYYLCGSNYMLTVDFNSAKPSFKKIQVTNITSMFVEDGNIHYIVDNKEFTDLGNTGTELELHYRSPNFTASSFDILKEFNKVNLTYKGSFIYKVIIDDVIVLTRDISSNKITVEEIQIPSEINEGLYISLELIGIGEIYNFRYLFSYENNN